MQFVWFRSTFLRVLKFLQLKEWGLISAENQFCRKSELFGTTPPFCISISKVFWTQTFGHSLDFNAFLWFRNTFLRFLKFLRIKQGWLNFWGGPILQNVCITWSPLLYFNFKSFMVTISSSFIIFQCKLHNLGVLFSEPWNFYKLKRGTWPLGRNNFAESVNYFVPLSVFKF